MLSCTKSWKYASGNVSWWVERTQIKMLLKFVGGQLNSLKAPFKFCQVRISIRIWNIKGTPPLPLSVSRIQSGSGKDPKIAGLSKTILIVASINIIHRFWIWELLKILLDLDKVRNNNFYGKTFWEKMPYSKSSLFFRCKYVKIMIRWSTIHHRSFPLCFIMFCLNKLRSVKVAADCLSSFSSLP